MVAEKFDSVVVGAGPAGVSAALTMAKAGLNVLMLERGEKPGTKNVFGGIIFSHHTEQIAPEFWKSAPIERRVIEHQYWFLSKDAHVVISHRNQRFNNSYNAFTVHRARFDPWLARLAEDAGAVLVNRTTAEDIIEDDGRIIGVRTDRGDVYADVVVAADGVNSMLALKAGLHEELKPESVALATKEVIAIPRSKIEERFNLRGDEGVAAMLIGWGLGFHAGFLYTNRDTISIGMGIGLKDLEASGARPDDLLENLKSHPSIRPIVEDGDLKEYSAHLIPEGGYDYVPRAYTDGMLVAGDAAMLVNVVSWEGTNLAIASGMLAGQTVIEAKKARDFSSRVLSRYQDRLNESFVLRDLRRFRRVPNFFASNPQFFNDYPELINEIMGLWHTVDAETKDAKIRRIKQTIWRHRSRVGLLKDLYGLWRIFS